MDCVTALGNKGCTRCQPKQRGHGRQGARVCACVRDSMSHLRAQCSHTIPEKITQSLGNPSLTSASTIETAALLQKEKVICFHVSLEP